MKTQKLDYTDYKIIIIHILVFYRIVTGNAMYCHAYLHTRVFSRVVMQGVTVFDSITITTL